MNRLTRMTAMATMAAALAGCEFSASTGGNGASDNGQVRGEVKGSVAPAMAHFVNSRENARSPGLQRNYVDFSFDYPTHWTITPQPSDGTASNYVRVAAPLIDGYEPFAFHVGHAYGTGNAESDRRDLDQALPQIAEQFGSTLQNYRITSIGQARVGSYDSWNWRFSATAPGINGGAPAQVFGRGDVILPPGATKGVLLLTLVTSRTNEVASPADVGESGTLKALFDSFRLGPSGEGSK
jgi:hypothetical protein